MPNAPPALDHVLLHVVGSRRFASRRTTRDVPRFVEVSAEFERVIPIIRQRLPGLPRRFTM